MSDSTIITIVSGLPRSGTSMMMRMLEAGGMPVLTDRIREADDDNPRGYWEYEPVKKTKQDSSWLDTARGCAVKMISMLLFDLPPEYTYRIIFMRRDMCEILASQDRMLARMGKKKGVDDDDKMGRLFESHLKKVCDWLAKQDHFQVLYVNYLDALQRTDETACSVEAFVGQPLNRDAMIGAVEARLYRNRASSSSPTEP